ncbi:pyrroline-5-carboxylate reductase [Reinekea forsetii]|nr:pyrroline-5-carboxylate reductase [Reinekea forsetii]
MSMNTIGFLGAGNMAGAIIKGLIASGFEAKSIWVFDRNQDKRDGWAALGLSIANNADDLVIHSDALVLSVKPQGLKETCESIASVVADHKPLILSVVAAIPAQSIAQWLSASLPIIRVMPNTPSLVQAGASGLFANNLCLPEHKAFAETVFRAVGRISWVEDEHLIHSVTAAAGSAPAYFFRFAEAMSKTALEQGLTEQQARTLIGQTMLGAAKMILETDEDIGQMRKNVCSPNGTTERAIFSFNDDQIDTVVNNAMKACFDRSVELTDLLSQ